MFIIIKNATHSQIKNLECIKTYCDDSFIIIGQARLSFDSGVLESVYIKTKDPDLCRQKIVIFLFRALQLVNGHRLLKNKEAIKLLT